MTEPMTAEQIAAARLAMDRLEAAISRAEVFAALTMATIDGRTLTPHDCRTPRRRGKPPDLSDVRAAIEAASAKYRSDGRPALAELPEETS